MAVCLGSAKVCALRVARLTANCLPIPGENNAVISTAIVRLQATPEYETGDEFIMKNGCGDICLSLKDNDKLKRMTLAMDLCTRDMELLELLTGGQLYTIDDEVVGFARRGVGATDPNPVSVEIWTRALDSTGACLVGSDPTWWRWVYPSATFTLGEVTHENGIGTVTLAGFAEPNPNWGNGPFNDWPADENFDPDSPEHFILDAEGPPAAACGYTSVPAGS